MNIAATMIDLIPDHESLFSNVSFNGHSFLLYAVYRFPDAVGSFLTQLYDYLLPYRDRNIILTGDFNLPTINWQ